MKSLADAVEDGRRQVRRERYKYELRRTVVAFGVVLSAMAAEAYAILFTVALAKGFRGMAVALNALAESLEVRAGQQEIR